jgi:hypothetical protein
MQLATRPDNHCIPFSYVRVEWSICVSTKYTWIRDVCYFYRGSQFYSMEHVAHLGLYELLREFHTLL